MYSILILEHEIVHNIPINPTYIHYFIRTDDLDLYDYYLSEICVHWAKIIDREKMIYEFIEPAEGTSIGFGDNEKYEYVSTKRRQIISAEKC